MFADVVDSSQALSSLGIPGLVVIIIVLAGVVVYKDKKYDKAMEQRLSDAKETRDKLTEPLAQQARLSEQIYELLINQRGK